MKTIRFLKMSIVLVGMSMLSFLQADTIKIYNHVTPDDARHVDKSSNGTLYARIYYYRSSDPLVKSIDKSE